MPNSKLIVTAAIAISAIAGISAASAADMAPRYTKAPPIAPVMVYDWSGFYVGINGGGGTSRKCWDVTRDQLVRRGGILPAAEGCHDATGGTVGGQVGYRWQATSWVFGLEAQGNWADFRGSNTSLAFPNVLNQTKIDSFGLFTGQLGYAWNNTLLYVKGGAAVVHDKYQGFSTVNGLLGDSASETRWGGVVGVGGEYGFTPNWSFAIEYDHMFMGNRDIDMFTSGNFGAAGIVDRTDRIRQDVDIITARVNYRFGGPVVAKY
jgi:outer membrane immunogenic protein